jgi:hypothetical protein
VGVDKLNNIVFMVDRVQIILFFVGDEVFCLCCIFVLIMIVLSSGERIEYVQVGKLFVICLLKSMGSSQ